MRGLILEGIPGSGKTAFLQGFLPLLTRHHRGPLWLATEHITERVLEPLAQASSTQARAHVASHLSHLFQLWEWEKAAPQAPHTGVFFLLERFHLSLESHISGLGSGEFASWDERLSAFNTHLLWFSIPPDQVLDRSVRSTLARRNQFWRRYLETLGMTEEAVAEHFVAEQEKMRTLFCRSRMPKTMIHLSPNSLSDTLRQVCDILELPFTEAL